MSSAETEFEEVESGPLPISERDLALLKNAATLTECLYVDVGNTIAIKNGTRSASLLMNAETTFTFPKEVAIADVGQLIAILDIQENPTIEFFDDYLYVSSVGSNSRIKWLYSEVTAIKPWIPSAKEIPMESAPDATFTLTKAELSSILTTSRQMKLEALYLDGDVEKGTLKLLSRKEVVRTDISRSSIYEGNQFEMNVTAPTVSSTFIRPINIGDLKFMSDDYDVYVHTEEGFVFFVAKNLKVRYWIAIQAD